MRGLGDGSGSEVPDVQARDPYTHLRSQGRKEGPCGSLASLSSQPQSSGFRERLCLKKSDESNGGKHQC